MFEVFQGCFKGVSRVFHGCFKGVSWVFQGYIKGFSRVFQGCFMGVSKVFQGCFEDVPKVFQGKFIAGFKVVTRLIQEDSLCVPRMSVWCSMGASWVCKRCVKSV